MQRKGLHWRGRVAQAEESWRVAKGKLLSLFGWLVPTCAVLLQASSASSQAGSNLLGNFVAHHQFGAATQHQAFSHEFLWPNTSTNPLVIRTVTSSCDCVQVAGFSRSIPPGGSGSIDLKITPKNTGAIDWLISAEIEGETAPRLFALSGEVSDGTPSSPPSPLFVQPKDTIREQAEGRGLVFVDVRSQDLYRLGHISGSLSLPLFTVKTKTFLRSRPIVLLNEGHSMGGLLSEAARLKEFQFGTVRVLDGGLRAWQQAGGALEGENPASAALGSITPQQFYLARHKPEWLVVGLGCASAPAEFGSLPLTALLPLESNNLPQELAALLEKTPTARRILLATPDGGNYKPFEKVRPAPSEITLFFLVGGADGYSRFLSQQLASQNRKVLTVSSQQQRMTASHGGAAVAGGGCCGGRK